MSLRDRLAVVAATLDARDAHVYGGLLVSFCGAALLSVAAALIGAGVVLMLFGVFGPRLGR